MKEDCIDRFKEITFDNARNTVQEPGAIRFDVFQNQDDPRFTLWESTRHPRHRPSQVY